jgi:hypothetical protein
MGSLSGAGKCIIIAQLRTQALLSHCDVAAGLLVLLISGRLTLSNISPLALTLSNTYGVPLAPSLCHVCMQSATPAAQRYDSAMH